MEAKVKTKPTHTRRPIWVYAVQAGMVLFLLGMAELLVTKGYVNRIFLASPSQIVQEFLYSLQTGDLLPNLAESLKEVAVGYSLSALLGIIIGVLFVTFPKAEAVFSPFFAAVMAVPKTAVMPLLVVWFGIGFQSKVIMVMLFCMFNILFNTVSGAKQTKAEHLKVAQVFQASRTQTVFQVMLPSALPGIFAGLRVTAATAITGVIFAEMTASKKGAGFLLNEAQAVLNTPRLFLVIILVTMISVLFVSFINLLERILCRRWRRV